MFGRSRMATGQEELTFSFCFFQNIFSFLNVLIILKISIIY